MKLPLTPERIAGAYTMLRMWPPFCRWGLPLADEVRFHVLKTKERYGSWWIDGEKHHIDVSQNMHGHLNTLLATVAHEMIHMHQKISKTETSNTEHNAAFRRTAALLCKRYGWDAAAFC